MPHTPFTTLITNKFTSKDKLFTSVGLPVESKLELKFFTRSLINSQSTDFYSFTRLGPGPRVSTLGLAIFEAVKQVLGCVAASVEVFHAGSLSGIVGPFLNKSHTGDQVGMNRRQGANVRTEMSKNVRPQCHHKKRRQSHINSIEKKHSKLNKYSGDPNTGLVRYYGNNCSISIFQSGNMVPAFICVDSRPLCLMLVGCCEYPLVPRRPQTIVLSFDPSIRSSTPQKKDSDLIQRCRGLNPQPSSSELIQACINPQDHGALAKCQGLNFLK